METKKERTKDNNLLFNVFVAALMFRLLIVIFFFFLSFPNKFLLLIEVIVNVAIFWALLQFLLLCCCCWFFYLDSMRRFYTCVMFMCQFISFQIKLNEMVFSIVFLVRHFCHDYSIAFNEMNLLKMYIHL